MLFKHRTSDLYIRNISEQAKIPYLHLPKKFAGTFNDYFANITERLYEKKYQKLAPTLRIF